MLKKVVVFLICCQTWRLSVIQTYQKTKIRMLQKFGWTEVLLSSLKRIKKKQKKKLCVERCRTSATEEQQQQQQQNEKKVTSGKQHILESNEEIESPASDDKLQQSISFQIK